MRTILEHTPGELGRAFAAEGIEPYRARQVARWLFARGVRDFEDMTDLGRPLRERLARSWCTRSLQLDGTRVAADGTCKLVLRTRDDARIESVIIPEEGRRTLCVSSQIGCSLACVFCATGRMGLVRNLGADEMVDQLLHANGLLAPRGQRITHVVFMGMGEPLLNPGNLLQAIRVLSHPQGGSLAARRITVSTAGVVPGIRELGEALEVRLSVSLHATTDELRDRLVPLNRRFPLARLLEACHAFPLARRDRISFEYVLIRGVNDSPEDARRLVGLLHGLRAKVNLIPLNEHPGTPYRPPGEAAVERFAEALAASGITATTRRSRGGEILAACGQLGAGPPVAGGLRPSGRG